MLKKNKKISYLPLFSLVNNYIDIENKKIFEKRKRNQAYIALDYIIGRLTYFDFFSSDAFMLAKYAKYYGQTFSKKTITSDLLLLSFFKLNLNLSEVIKNLGLSEEMILTTIMKNDSSMNLKKNLAFDKNFNDDKLNYVQDLKYSYESHLLFEKAATNAVYRFKTPVITAEILFLTMMEEKNSKVSKLIKLLISNADWYLLRYRLIKNLHNQEANIRGEVSKNQQYFAYLLKINLADKDFDKLVVKEKLMKGVNDFRNTLISEVIKMDIFNFLSQEIKFSMKLTNNRKYS